MNQSRLRELEDQCIQDCAPPCDSACPVHVDVRGLMKAVSEGRFTDGLSIYNRAVPFPGIISRLCEEPCRASCYREAIGGAIRISDIEKACVQFGEHYSNRKNGVPNKHKVVNIIGGGLTGMTAALDLARKGYIVHIYERVENPGGRLLAVPEEKLPSSILKKEIGLLADNGVMIHTGKAISALDDMLNSADAVLLATGSANRDFLIPTGDDQREADIHPITFQVNDGPVFAAGSILHEPSFIFSISDGKRAAISLDRYLQRVSLTASRINEGSYKTRLFTSISGIPVVKEVEPQYVDPGYSKEEAIAEASRCLQCECMECVKVCEYLKQYKSYPKKYVREIYNNLTIIKRPRTANKFINSCTQCGLCKEVCPTDVDMGEVTLDARRTMVDTKKMPAAAHDFALRDMAFSNSDKFSADFVPKGSSTCSTAFFPGCQLAASNPDYILHILNDLREKIPEIGVMLGCCGAPAEWSGEENLYKNVEAKILNRWRELGEPELIMACSSCHQLLMKNIPSGKLKTLWEFYDDKQLKVRNVNSGSNEYVVHDPCTSRHESDWQNGARRFLKNIKVNFHELGMSRNLTECCGYGGVAWLANPPLVKDMISRRVQEDKADYLTYCVMCRDIFASSGKRTLHLLDLLYAPDIEKAATRRPPDYSQRHENRIRVKHSLEKDFLGKENSALETFENYHLLVDSDVRETIESRLILLEDIQKVIEKAETTGVKFLNQKTGHNLAFFKPNIITYWVEYQKSGTGYRVFDAYSHRMEFDGKGTV